MEAHKWFNVSIKHIGRHNDVNSSDNLAISLITLKCLQSHDEHMFKNIVAVKIGQYMITKTIERVRKVFVAFERGINVSVKLSVRD